MKMRIAGAVLLMVSAAACAQVSSPELLIGKPPGTTARARAAQRGENLQWMFQYAAATPNGEQRSAQQGNKPALLLDGRFADMLHAMLRAPQSMWGVGQPLADVAREFLGDDGAVQVSANRYVTVDGCVAELCSQRGLLWVDEGGANTREPLVVFAALRWAEQSKTADEPGAPYNLWLFPSREIDPMKMPQALKEAVGAWAGRGGCRAPTVQNALVVEPDGVPHVVGSLAVGVTPKICVGGEGK